MPRTIRLVVCFALLASGCANQKRTVAAYEPGGEGQTRPAPKSAQYILLCTDDAVANGEYGLAVRQLSSRDAVGFAREHDGRLVAVAGGYRLPLDEGHYRWAVLPADGSNKDGRLATAASWYMAGIEPVGKALATVALAPVALGFFALAALGVPFPIKAG